MREIGGAIERIHVPAVLAAGVAQSFLLAEHVMPRPSLSNAFANQGFRFAIGRGNQVGFAFVLDANVLVEKFQ